MLCLACREWSSGVLCDACRSTLRAAPDAHLGFLVRSAFDHSGAARTLVHRLKYDGIPAVARLLAPFLAAKLPPGTAALVPIPRSLLRRLRYGIDPGRELARATGREAGLPVFDCLRAELWYQPNAGRGRGHRHAPHFEVGSRPGGRLVLVDDVLTTGGTLSAARAVLGEAVVGAVAATRSRAGAAPGR